MPQRLSPVFQLASLWRRVNNAKLQHYSNNWIFFLQITYETDLFEKEKETTTTKITTNQNATTLQDVKSKLFRVS